MFRSVRLPTEEPCPLACALYLTTFDLPAFWMMPASSIDAPAECSGFWKLKPIALGRLGLWARSSNVCFFSQFSAHFQMGTCHSPPIQSLTSGLHTQRERFHNQSVFIVQFQCIIYSMYMLLVFNPFQLDTLLLEINLNTIVQGWCQKGGAFF